MQLAPDDLVEHQVGVRIGVRVLPGPAADAPVVARDADDPDLLKLGEHLPDEPAQDRRALDADLPEERRIDAPRLAGKDHLALDHVAQDVDPTLLHGVVGAAHGRDPGDLLRVELDPLPTDLRRVARADFPELPVRQDADGGLGRLAPAVDLRRLHGQDLERSERRLGRLVDGGDELRLRGTLLLVVPEEPVVRSAQLGKLALVTWAFGRRNRRGRRALLDIRDSRIGNGRSHPGGWRTRPRARPLDDPAERHVGRRREVHVLRRLQDLPAAWLLLLTRPGRTGLRHVRTSADAALPDLMPDRDVHPASVPEPLSRGLHGNPFFVKVGSGTRSSSSGWEASHSMRAKHQNATAARWCAPVSGSRVWPASQR